METLTPLYIANVFVNLPPKLRDFVVKAVPPGLLTRACWMIQNRQLDRKEFVAKLEEARSIFEKEQEEIRKNFKIEGFELGEIRTATGQYWEGKEIEIVEFVMGDHMPLRVKYQGSIISFKPEWLKTRDSRV